MKILIIYNSGLLSIDGDYYIENSIGEFALDLKKQGHEVVFFGQKTISSEQDIRVFPILKNNIKLIALNRKKNKIYNYILLYLLSIYAVIKSDFVYLFFPNAFKYVAVISVLLRKRLGLYIRGMDDLDDKLSLWIYRHSNVILTVSPFFTDLVNNYVGKPVAESIKPMIQFSEKHILDKRVYESKDSYQIFYIGRIVDDKGLDELLNATSILLKSAINVHLNIVGSGEYLSHVEQLIIDLGIKDNTTVINGIYDPKEIIVLYEKSDIFILPSYHEGFPRTIYEAMIFGLPIVTTAVGGIPAIMKDNYNCRMINARSIDDIVKVLTELTTNYPSVKYLVENAQLTVTPIVHSKRPNHAKQLSNLLITENISL